MQHFVLKVSDVEILEAELAALTKSHPHLTTARILVQIYSMHDPQYLRMVTGSLCEHLSNIDIVGCSAMGLIHCDGYVASGAVISFTVFEYSSFHIDYGHIESGNEYECSRLSIQA